MDYYKLLQLEREPFSNSPDPDYFFQSRQHLGCLQKLELALRLKRGLNVVIGDVGTGKTTLCRQLIRNFSKEDHIESHLILDPTFAATRDFLIHLHDLICAPPAKAEATEVELKENVKQALFSKGVDQDKTIVLIIDEGQKISEACVEILRELLNFETNTFKLLQIVIFAQLEFNRILEKHANFSDRINVLHHLAPMNFKDTRQMIHHRLKLSSNDPAPRKLFTLPAIWAIYRASRGYPRKIIHLCHQSMLTMIIQNRTKAGWPLIRSCRKRIAPVGQGWRKIALPALFTAAAVLAIVMYAPKLVNQDGPSFNPNAFKVYEEKTLNQIMAESPLTAIEHRAEPEALPDTAAIETAMQDKPAPADTAPSPDTSAPGAAPFPDEDLTTTEAQAPIAPVIVAPTSLGRLIVKPGDTLLAMVNRVYGTLSNKHLRAVIDSNTQIADPNRIDIGNIIEFPPLPFGFKQRAMPVHWVFLEEHKTLPSAMQRSHEITKTMRLPLQMVGMWSPAAGLRFQLLVKGYFPASQDATAYLQALPEEIAARGYVIYTWPEDTTLYSNPYGSGAH